MTTLNILNYEEVSRIYPATHNKVAMEAFSEFEIEARSQRARASELTPPVFSSYPIGSVAVDRFNEVYELRLVPITEMIFNLEGTQLSATVEKYTQWLEQGFSPPPLKGVENYLVHNGKIKITNGRHRILAAQKAGLDALPVWVALTNPLIPTRPVLLDDYVFVKGS